MRECITTRGEPHIAYASGPTRARELETALRREVLRMLVSKVGFQYVLDLILLDRRERYQSQKNLLGSGTIRVA